MQNFNWFAVSKDSLKIVKGWEYPHYYSLEQVTEFFKADIAAMYPIVKPALLDESIGVNRVANDIAMSEYNKAVKAGNKAYNNFYLKSAKGLQIAGINPLLPENWA